MLLGLSVDNRSKRVLREVDRLYLLRDPLTIPQDTLIGTGSLCKAQAHGRGLAICAYYNEVVDHTEYAQILFNHCRVIRGVSSSPCATASARCLAGCGNTARQWSSRRSHTARLRSFAAGHR